MPQMNGATLLKSVAHDYKDIQKIILTGYEDLDFIVQAVNEGKINYFLSKPCDEKQLTATIQACIEKKSLRDKNRQLKRELKQKNIELKALNQTLELKVAQRTKDLDKALETLTITHQASIKLCSDLIENYHGKYRGHTKQIAVLARELGKKLNLSSLMNESLYTAGLLYCIGKVGLPPAITDTPLSNLSLSQRKIFHQYPVIGATILSSMPGFDVISDMVLRHREYLNGSGFPNKLSGEQISQADRILAVAVDFILLQKGLLLDAKLTFTQALENMQSSKKYDQDIIKILPSVIDNSIKKEVMIEKVLEAQALKPGMILSKDLISAQGVFLLSRGVELNTKSIENLKKIDNLTIYVY